MIKGIRKMIISAVLACMCLTISFAEPAPTTQSDRIHCVTDISHEFTFYFDGRFGRNYVVPNGIDVSNWGTLHKYDFSNVNLLILQSSASPCPYLPEDIEAVRKFLTEGCGVVVLGALVKRASDRRKTAEFTMNVLWKVFFQTQRSLIQQGLPMSSKCQCSSINSWSSRRKALSFRHTLYSLFLLSFD